MLFGTEIKSIRANKVNLNDSFARIDKGEAWLIGAHIAPWESTGNRENHEPKRDRKLLLHRGEIASLYGKVREKGLTLVPTRMYWKDGRAKVEIALARGKDVGDKRRSLKERELRREMERAVSARD